MDSDTTFSWRPYGVSVPVSRPMTPEESVLYFAFLRSVQRETERRDAATTRVVLA